MLEVVYGATIDLPITKETLGVIKHYKYIDKQDNILFSCFVDNTKKVIKFPRDLHKFTQYLEPLGYKLKHCVVDKAPSKPIELTGLALRDFQKPIAEEVNTKLSEGFNVVLNAETGLGKSYLVPYFISQLQQKTLILVDQTTLAHQMYDEIVVNSNANVGILCSGGDLYDVNIATIQLLLKNPQLLKRLQEEVGFVIVDECHFISINTFTEVVQSIPSKYRLGLSATPTRSDGMTDVIYDVMGRNVVIGKNPNALKVTVHRVSVHRFFTSGAREYKKNLDQFIKNNKKEILTLVDLFVKDDRVICVATDIKDTQRFLCDLFNKHGIPAEVVNSDINVQDRKKVFSRLNTKKTRVVVGMAVLEKGVSIPRLDTILHISGANTKEKIAQLEGRLKREHPDKQSPLLVDLCFLGSLERQQNIRQKTYNKNELPTKNYTHQRYVELWEKKNKGAK